MTSAFGNYYTHRPALVRVLLMFLRNCCAKIAAKKRTHNTNSTGMSVNLVVCVLAVLSLSGAQKGRGQFMRHTNVQAEDGILYLPWYMAIFFKQEQLSKGLTYEVDLSGL